jgi:hydrogenase-1 operon protein HyaF
MNINNIPVRVVGPGSQQGKLGEPPIYIDMPNDMARYDPPLMPGPEEVQHLAGAREAMAWLRAALAECNTTRRRQLADLTQIDDDSRKLVNQILGEGEVSISFDGAPRAHVQESVLAGIWRTFYFDDDDRIAIDLLEVADVPHIVNARRDDAKAIDTTEPAPSQDVPNAMPILVELEDRRLDFERNGKTHTINLTLLPLSQAELEFIDRRLGRGPVDVLSRAYGKCEVISTHSANVWWVRYFNSMGTLILNTLEITGVPQVVVAASEDIRDSAHRLNEILLPYWPDNP